MDSDQIDISLNWKNKEANRIPEASWMMFNFALEKDTPCYLNKMGEYISPYEVVENGNRALHAVWKDIKCSVYNNSGNPKTMELVLESLEAPLVSIGNPRILEFDQTNPDISEGIYINLHNNLWGTNFPMWYEDDGFFRFKLTFREV